MSLESNSQLEHKFISQLQQRHANNFNTISSIRNKNHEFFHKDPVQQFQYCIYIHVRV